MKSEFYGTEIFLDNEATREYLDICRRALARELGPNEYYEEHQVIPAGYWSELPGAVKGKLSQAMPKEAKVSCRLLPQEHYRAHYLLTQMFTTGTKAHAHAVFDLRRRNASSPEEYQRKQIKANKDKNWRSRAEHLKYEEM